MKDIFIDSSVLISFCASKTGASAKILEFCRKRLIQGHISHKVILEVRKNTTLKIGAQARSRFEYILKQNFLIIEPDLSEAQIQKCLSVINAKDASILAAALENVKITHLVTLDKKDFLKPEVIAFSKPKKIMIPAEFIKEPFMP